ncbi:MAG: Hpt domain-containing protein [Bryobacteraceae bacterium]|nr:Hpt domain-containing protein [Bryobacteraceae bacterium]
MNNNLSLLNLALALDRVGGDQELLEEVAQLFLEDYPNSIAEIEQALANGDPRGVERGAHSLKGAVSNFGADSVVETALALELAGRQGDLSTAPEQFIRLNERLSALHEELAAICRH